MALINCKYCGKQVSSRAVTCPHCGESLSPSIESNSRIDIRKTRQKKGVSLVFINVMIALLTIPFLIFCIRGMIGIPSVKSEIHRTKQEIAEINKFKYQLEDFRHNNSQSGHAFPGVSENFYPESIHVYSEEQLGTGLPGTVWTCRPDNGDMWYRIEFSDNEGDGVENYGNGDFAYATSTSGRWTHLKMRWWIFQGWCFGSETKSHVYTIGIRLLDGDGIYVAKMGFFDNGTVWLVGLDQKQHIVTRGDYNWN